MPFWVTVAAKHGEEYRAVTNTRPHYPVYQPQFFDRRRKVRRPLFGRYFFVELGKDRTRWGKVHYVRGVHYVLCNNGQLVFIRDDDIEMLRKGENQNGLHDLPDTELFAHYPRKPVPIEVKHFDQGQNVRILKGSFAGNIGIFEGQTVQQREKVTLDWLGAVFVSINDLEAVYAH